MMDSEEFDDLEHDPKAIIRSVVSHDSYRFIVTFTYNE